ncbi:hypothetical protein M426DRAFT_261999 [Hypoxylon sp. CI-4A]|nr:hypothetical protein M426DRAFT_261999 [Hypoxylon sp. CI-4A]
MASSLSHRGNGVSLPAPAPEPLGGIIFGVILSFFATSIISSFLVQRVLAVKSWRRLPLIIWYSISIPVVFIVYGISWIFVFATGILNYGIGVSSNLGVCSAAIELCLFCYISTKIDLDSIYAILSILSFVYRIARMENGRCIIGIERPALIPFITFDIVVNVYLTTLFLNPLRNIYAFKGLSSVPSNPPKLRAVAVRTLVGTLCTTASSVVNLVVLMALDGEPGWVCLTCCNADILFSALVIQWITSRDNAGTIDSSHSVPPDASNKNSFPPPPPGPSPILPRRSKRIEKLSISLPLSTTSTSQYEHIFGDLEPETETDLVSGSGTSATTTRDKPASTGFNIYDDNDNDHTPVANSSSSTPASTSTSTSQEDGEESTASARNGKARAQQRWTDIPLEPRFPFRSLEVFQPPAPASARRDRSAAAAAAATSTVSPPASPTAAADLERIRRYRDRHSGKPTPSASTSASVSTPTPTPPPVTAGPSRTGTGAGAGAGPRSRSTRTDDPNHEYYISQLIFDEDDITRWSDLVRMESQDGGGSGSGSGSGNWI